MEYSTNQQKKGSFKNNRLIVKQENISTEFSIQYISFPPRLRYNVSVYHSISETEQYISNRTVATLDNQGAKLTANTTKEAY